MAFAETETPARFVGRGRVEADCVLPARFFPKMVIRLPGAMGPALKLAELTTLALGFCGVLAGHVILPTHMPQ